MTREPLTRDDVVKTFGAVGEPMIADLLATGATVTELVVALDRMRDASSLQRYPEGRVGAVCEVLKRWNLPDEPEYLGTD